MSLSGHGNGYRPSAHPARGAEAMAEERKLSISEVRKTIATSLSAAFGFVIALTWNTVVQSAFATADIPLGATATSGNWGGWATFVVSAVVITVVMVVFIVLMGRLAGKEAKA